jgi:FAD dependent oxidoreductase
MAMRGWHSAFFMGAAVAALLSACGGGSDGAKPPPGERVVSLAPNTSFTPWSSGSLVFRIEPPTAGTETVTCSIDSGTAAPCAGRVDYTSLASGAHELRVTIAAGTGSTSYLLPWEIRAPDVTVVGATPAGISAAIAAARAGRAVALLEPSKWVGGMMTGGLSKSDVGGAGGTGLGGIAREFFDRTRDHEEATGACPFGGACPNDFDFEPKAAKFIFEAMLAEQKLIYLEKGIAIDSVEKSGTTITALRTRRGPITSDVVIDASYEGDVAVMAGVSTVIGREARASGGDPGLVEDAGGIGSFVPPYGLAVDPYVVPGDPASGTLPFVQPKAALPAPGTADSLVMAYNYRMCVTDDPGNRIPFARPADYDPQRYEGSARVAVAMEADGRTPLDELYFNPATTVRSADERYFKRDLNGGSVFSTDMSAPDWNQAYPPGSTGAREAIAQSYKSYIQGLLYFWQTDPRFGPLNAKVAAFGLCKDEFTDNDHWPYRLYTRETRRMVGEYVMNQNDVLQNGRRAKITASIGMGAYSMDSHTRQITVASLSVGGAPARDVVVSEGFEVVRIPGYTPYPVHYQSLVPRRAQVTNLLNPVTLSATSLAYSSLRMEPAFMIFGQAAGTAAALASEGGVSVQAISVATLQSRLRSAGQILYLD